MPRSLPAWYSRNDLELLADRETTVSGELRVSKLRRLDGLVHTGRSGSIVVTLAAERTTVGRLMLRLALRGTLVVTCQRCLEPFDWDVDERTAWLIVDADSEAVGMDWVEPVLALDEGRLSVEALLEDELIVALPMAPRHETVDDCGPLAENLRAVQSDVGADRVVESRDV